MHARHIPDLKCRQGPPLYNVIVMTMSLCFTPRASACASFDAPPGCAAAPAVAAHDTRHTIMSIHCHPSHDTPHTTPHTRHTIEILSLAEMFRFVGEDV